MEKVIRPGLVKTFGTYHAEVYIKIIFTNGNLSLTGVIGPRSNGDAYGSAGQINMGFRSGTYNEDKIANYAPG